MLPGRPPDERRRQRVPGAAVPVAPAISFLDFVFFGLGPNVRRVQRARGAACAMTVASFALLFRTEDDPKTIKTSPIIVNETRVRRISADSFGVRTLLTI